MAQENPADGRGPVRGRLTYVDLSRTASFFLPWEQDPWGRLRPPFKQDLVRMSLELSRSAYDLRIGDWMRAGWTDFSFQVDTKLVGGVSPAQAGEARQFLYNKWAVYRARAHMRQLNPVGQVMSAMRQRQGSDTGKALVMIRPAADGRYVVAIGLRGTGVRFYDWFSNFRFASENGIHQGFYQLARQFEENAERIEFPETARTLGLEKLTLSQIVAEARYHGSRFRLWLCGHSQGAAVMQVLAHLWIKETGVLPENLIGYGFASPTVMMGTAVPDPAAYPLYHVLNSDDYVPRAGAQVHLGVCLVYPAGEELRHTAYGWRETPQADKTRAMVRRLTRRMVDMPTLIESGMAYLQALAALPMKDALTALHLMPLKIAPLPHLISAAGASPENLLRFVSKRIQRAYFSLTGHELDPALVGSLQSQTEAAMREAGPAEFSRALGEMALWAHTLSAAEGKRYSAYQYIVLRGLEELHPTIWQSGSPPSRVWLEVPRELPAPEAEAPAVLFPLVYNRRRSRPVRRQPKKRIRGFSSSRRLGPRG